MDIVSNACTLKGVIRHTNGKPAQQVKVAAYNKQFRSESKLGEGWTDDEGRYTILYHSDNTAVNLVVRVYGADARCAAESPVRFESGSEEVVNLTVSLKQNDRQSEYEKLLTSLSGPLESENPGGLTQEDLLFLSKSTKIEPEQIQHYVRAWTAANELRLSNELLYGLSRKLLPLELSKLLSIPAPKLKAVLESAADEGMISVMSREEIPSFLERLPELLLSGLEAGQGLRAGVREGGIGDFLKAAALSRVEQTRLSELVLGHEGDPESLWSLLKEDAELAKHADRIRLVLQLKALTKGQLPLVNAILNKLDEADQESTADLRKLVLWNEGDWQALQSFEEMKAITNENASPWVAEVMQTLDQVYPSLAVVRKLRTDDKFDMRDEVLAFMDDHPDFDLKTSSVDTFMKQARGGGQQRDIAVRSGLETANRLTNRLKSMQRIFRLVPSYEPMKSLLEDGIHSSLGISQFSRESFVSGYAEKVGGEEIAGDIYSRAASVTSTALALFGQIQEAARSVQFSATTVNSAEVAALTTSLPDWSEMFGALEWCDCEHCRTVYSPAAYLVDLLQMLSKMPAAQGTVLQVLLERRPDIGQLELSCENTNITLPYIDLVNELLENAVSPETAVPATRTTGSIEELSAQPEYLNTGAYDRLSQKVYPFQLPFSLWHEEARVYLEQMNVYRERLMEAFRPLNTSAEAPGTELAIAAETLKLYPSECSIIIGLRPEGRGLYYKYGFAESNIGLETWVQAMSKVPLLLERTGLSFTELEELLAASFINPADEMSIERDESSCSVESAVVANLSEDALERIHRFVRLLRRLNHWTISQLDHMLSALGGQLLNENFIIRLAEVLRLSNELQVPGPDLVYWWDRIETTPAYGQSASMYERLFLNKTVAQPVDQAFVLREPFRDELADPTGYWKDHKPTLLAAFQLSGEELSLLAEVCLPDDRLTLGNLSLLYAQTQLAKAMGLPITDYTDWMRLVPVAPFTGGADKVQNTATFVRLVRRAAEAGFSAGELLYILRHEGTETAPSELEISGLLATLRSELAEIADDTDSSANVEELRKSAAARRLSEFTNLNAGVITPLITACLTVPSTPELKMLDAFLDPVFINSSEAITKEGFIRLFQSVIKLVKIAALVTKLGLQEEEMNFFISKSGSPGWPDWDAVPLEPAGNLSIDAGSIARIKELIDWRDRYTFGSSDWIKLFELADSSLPEQEAQDDLFTCLAELTGWKKEEIKVWAGLHVLHLQYPQDYRDERWLLRLAEGFSLMKRLNVSSVEAKRWTVSGISINEVRSIRQALKAKSSEQQWLSVAKSLRNRLREKQRSALSACLKHDFYYTKRTDDLFAYFLIDVEMGAMQETSRIKQAISSVQLFVQRCLMNLEPGIHLSHEAEEDWKKIRNYRVWEANRKIFLYPENWLEPELRDNRSPFFNELQKEFMENEAKLERAEASFMNYMKKLDQVSRLDIIAMYHQYEDHGNGIFTDILHVFGRTQNSPHIYYYRRFENSLSWTAWEKVDTDIEGEHLIPVLYKSRLYLFWPIFKEQAKTPDVLNPSGEKPQKFLQVGLAWSEYRFGSWSPKTVTNANLDMTGQQNKENIAFHSYIDEENSLIIEAIIHYNGYSLYSTLFYFKLNNPDGKVNVYPVYSGIQGKRFPLPDATDVYNNAIRPFNEGSGRVVIPIDDNNGSYNREDTIYHNDTYKIVFPQNNLWFDGSRPYFYQDAKRVLFVTSSPYKTSLLEDNRLLAGGFGLSLTSPYGGGYLLFHTAFHPYVTAFVEKLNNKGIDGLLSAQTQSMEEEFFEAEYQPLTEPNEYGFTGCVSRPFPKENVDFTVYGPYSVYNWEIFFHTPLLLADRLSKNQQFEEAQRWFHYIFDPTDSSSPETKGYWKLLPFRQNDATTTLREYMMLLHYEGTDPGTLNRKLEFEKLIAAWKSNPFNPHLIARIRISSYQKLVVMKYLDNLIAWADQLFRQDTIESINEATQLYLLAGELLGERRRSGNSRPQMEPKSFTDLQPELDSFSNALVQLENWMPSASYAFGGESAGPGLQSLGSALYFSIPPNDKLLGYWDTVADRLFKIRNSMSIDGTVRQLSLFQAPIDPGLLTRAASAGLDVGGVIQEVNGPLPQYRYQTMAHKAEELCGEVKAYGAALLTALEKRDSEKLSILRSSHEVTMHHAVIDIKRKQAEESREALEALYRQREMVKERELYYLKQPYTIALEVDQLKKLEEANERSEQIMHYEIAAQLATQIPNITIGTSGIASPVLTAQLGGSNISTGLQAYARYLNHLSMQDNYKAGRSGTIAGYVRRYVEWQHQAQMAKMELRQLEKQIVAAEIRLSIAERELKNQELQAKNTMEVHKAMQSKFTNTELYDWMVAQTSALFFRSYQLAYDTAKRAERAFQFELGTDKTFIKFGHWDSMKKGLFAGERLMADLKRLSLAYLELNKREYELTRHISVALLDPIALIQLKETGECFIELPERFLDMDYPGHYNRRIKSVGLSIPCVTGPYASVNCTLTLLQSSIRKSAQLSSGKYARQSSEDGRFLDQYGLNQAITTSSAQNDSGMFETNLRDERYLPFEGAGAVSRWKLTLPKACNSFDTDTIADVILHMRYTAREGGEGLRAAVMNEVVEAGMQENRVLLLPCRTQFSAEWHRFLHPSEAQDGQRLRITLTEQFLPYRQRGKTVQITDVELFVKWKDDAQAYSAGSPLRLSLYAPNRTDMMSAELLSDPVFGGVPHGIVEGAASSLGEWTIAAAEEDIAVLAETYRVRVTAESQIHDRLNSQMLEDLWFVIRYKAE
ncbi:virulence plasmid A protein [Paenibacillus sophorae]|uniref:Virulence plasmid A protein n=1 Tax=Paenibacillus sophorae TaxID=1333845 RepID=A0A1H8F8E4_9BACL|nr:neuraminidase-like domain-containing protein [Paenibacillus sophorae]QWU13792.1 hypothetical protein KP014_17690 [Paenibacillus sophorae]SEN27880.1 virulence plasmid A protein [Paenibacillus sophorae]